MLVTDLIAKNIGKYDKIIVRTPEGQEVEIVSKKQEEMYLKVVRYYDCGNTLLIIAG